MKKSDIIIILAVLAVSIGGSLVTGDGMEWYATINLPSFTPDGSIIGAVWTTIFILTAASAMRVSRTVKKKKDRDLIYAAFLLNAALNVLWSAIFFGLHLTGLAILEAAALGLSVIWIIILLWRHDKLAASLLIPYAGWVAFATFLTYSVWSLN